MVEVERFLYQESKEKLKTAEMYLKLMGYKQYTKLTPPIITDIKKYAVLRYIYKKDPAKLKFIIITFYIYMDIRKRRLKIKLRYNNESDEIKEESVFSIEAFCNKLAEILS